MARRRRMTETIVGIFVLASLALLLVLVIFIGRQQNIFQESYQIHGYFKSVGGLQTGADVQLAGISVGHVKEINFARNNRVKVVLNINENQRERIREDSVANIQTFGLMGDRYVAVTVGSEDESVIPSGGTIETEEIIELADALEAARPTLENLENTMQNISNLTDRLASPESDVAGFLNNLKTITSDVREGKGTIGALVQRDDLYEKTTTVLDTTQQTMRNFEEASANVQQASTDLPVLIDDLRSSLVQLEQFSANAAAASAEVYNLIEASGGIMKDAEIVADNLRDASEDIKMATPRIPPLIESADEGVNEAKDVIEAAKKSWLIRGYFEKPLPDGPIAIGERDIARPEVTQ